MDIISVYFVPSSIFEYTAVADLCRRANIKAQISQQATIFHIRFTDNKT
jgi:hypothetical protein